MPSFLCKIPRLQSLGLAVAEANVEALEKASLL
jgi:hypothetical protein